MSKKILSFDLGYGSIKVGYKTPTGQFYYQKIVTAIGQVEENDIFDTKDTNFYEYENEFYYIGQPALYLPSKQLIDLNDYKSLRRISPIIIQYYLDKLDTDEHIKFDSIVVGLSLAYSKDSIDYKKHLESKLKLEVTVLPQGISSMFAIEKYGLDPTDESQTTNGKITDYIGIDLGFNTVDIFNVIRRNCSLNATRGYEGQGVIVVAKKLKDYVTQQQKIELSVQDFKNILETGSLSHRGIDIDLSEKIHEYVVDYLIDTIDIVEADFEAAINKVKRLIMVGGGASLIKKYLNDSKLQTYLSQKYPGNFLVIPNLPEFYNMFGYYAKAEAEYKSQVSSQKEN